MAATIYGPVTGAATWGALGAHAGRLATTTLRELFASDPGRVGGLTVTACGIHADLSKQRVTDRDPAAAGPPRRRERGVPERIDAMFARRADQRHRGPFGAARRAADAPRRVARRRRDRRRGRGARGARPDGGLRRPGARRGRGSAQPASAIRNVVNIGIGGSDLGPVMAYDALRLFSEREHDLPLRVERRRRRLRRGDARPRPGRDAVHHVSKTFTTQETMTNAGTARDWLVAGLGDEQADVARHFVAVSTNAEDVADVRHRHREHVRVLGLGRRAATRWTRAIGLSTMLAIGPEHFARAARRLPRHGRALPHRAARAEPSGADGAARRAGTATSSAPRRRRCCRTTSTCSASRRTCSS